MERVHLNLKKKLDSSYDILVDAGLLQKVSRDLIKNKIGNKFVVITDSNVIRIYRNKIKKAFSKIQVISFKAGEQNKNLATLNLILDKMLSLGLDRKSAVIAFGGGVVGDVAGLAAATYMRGINYVQIPTTLLAAVDSSIGGKVAVDLKHGKNFCGAFFQPKRVYIDTNLLRTLPKKEVLNGLAEIIKHAIIADRSLFNLLEKNIGKIIQMDSRVIKEVIKRNCKIKAKVVEKDEKESNLRMILNFGHTVGHALETLTNYKKYTHGEALAIGMVVEATIAEKLGILNKSDKKKIVEPIEKIGLPTKLPKIKSSVIVKQLLKDKKVVSNKIRFVFPERIGKMKSIRGGYGINVPDNVIIKSLEACR